MPAPRPRPAPRRRRPPRARTTTEADSGADTTAAGGGGADVDLTGICPDPLVIQTDWFPEPDHGYTYQAIGTEGTVDATTGTYSGPLGDTGITLEIRAGGPFINFSPPAQQIYADPSIFAGYADTGDVIRNAGGEQPLVSIFASYDVGPQILMWDPAAYPDMQTIEDVKASGATVLLLRGRGLHGLPPRDRPARRRPDRRLLRRQPGRFVAEQNLVQQGFATNEVYKYQNDIPDWNKPVEFLLIHDTGFDIYQSALSVKPETMTESADCLAALVPIFQQSLVDYVTNPEPMNEKFVEIVTELDTFWTLDAGRQRRRRAADARPRVGQRCRQRDDRRLRLRTGRRPDREADAGVRVEGHHASPPTPPASRS